MNQNKSSRKSSQLKKEYKIQKKYGQKRSNRKRNKSWKRKRQFLHKNEVNAIGIIWIGRNKNNFGQNLHHRLKWKFEQNLYLQFWQNRKKDRFRSKDTQFGQKKKIFGQEKTDKLTIIQTKTVNFVQLKRNEER